MRAAGSQQERVKIWSEGFGATMAPTNRAANQVAAPIVQRLEGVTNLVAPVSYLRDSKGEGSSFTRRVQYWLIDQATDPNSSGVTRSAAGLAAAAMQPGAALNDIVHAVAGVPARLRQAGTDIREAFQAESGTAATYELAEAVERAAGAAEVTVGSFLLVRGARNANARVIEESRSSGNAEAVPAKGKSPPIDDYDVAAWEAYNRAHPEVARSVGAAGRRSLRKQLYPDRTRRGIKETLEDQGRDAAGEIRCQGPGCGKVLKPGEGTVEHNPSLVDSHNTRGFNTNQPTRNDIFNETATEIRCIDCQRSQGGRMRQQQQTYRTDTGPDFKPRERRRRR